MKWIVPPEFEMGACKYKIFRSQKVLEKLESAGHLSVSDEHILLPDKDLSPERMLVCLFHELDHLANNTIGVDQDEREVDGRANMMAQAILSMGIEPDFSQVPKAELREAE